MAFKALPSIVPLAGGLVCPYVGEEPRGWVPEAESLLWKGEQAAALEAVESPLSWIIVEHHKPPGTCPAGQAEGARGKLELIPIPRGTREHSLCARRYAECFPVH